MGMIEVKDVWKAFGTHQVLKGLTLTIEEGETLVILGRSGVGKSVLLRHIIGLTQPDRGAIFVKGIDVTQMGQQELYQAVGNMGMLFQGAALFDSMTVGENTAFYLDQHGDPETGKKLSFSEIKKRVAHALDLVDLAGTEEKMPSDLSGGMRKRAALARVIVYRPHIILYDEPTTGLDPITSRQINEMIRRIQENLGATSIVVTHDIQSALTVGDRMALHDQGRIAHLAPTNEFVKIEDPLIQGFFGNDGSGYASA